MSQLVKIRQFTVLDQSELARLANNKNVWDNLRDYIPFPYTEKDAESFIRLNLKENPQQNFGIAFDNELCGVIGLIPQKDVYRKSAEIGYWLGEPFWGKGIATEAVRQITEYGFARLGIIRIYSGVFDYNIASMKVLEKNGFKKEGIFRNAIIKNGKVFDEHRYYLLNDND